MEMKLNLKDAKQAAKEVKDPLRTLHRWGLRSNHAYLAAFAALGLALVLRLFSGKDRDSGSRASGLGGLLGSAVPVLMLLGLGLSREE